MQKAVKTMLALTAVLAATAVQAVSFPIGTYVYAGTLNRYDNRAMTAEDEMTIEAVSTNGNILAVATVRSRPTTRPTATGSSREVKKV